MTRRPRPGRAPVAVAPPSPRSRVAYLLPLVFLLEIAWFVWFESVHLYNAQGLPRWVILSRALPHVIPGVTFPESILGITLKELLHVEHLPQRLPLLAAAALIASAALALGDGLIRLLRLGPILTRWERLALAFGLGSSGLGAITLILGRWGLLNPSSARIGLGLLATAGLVSLARGWKTRQSEPIARPGWGLLGTLALCSPFLLLMTLGAMLPTVDFDAIEYHLQGPKEYYQAGRIRFLPHNVYTSMPFGVEMLHLLGMEVLDDWWAGALVGQLLIALHAPFAALMIGLTAARLASPRAGHLAALVYLTTPWVYRLAVLPYVEGPLGYYHAALLWAALRAWPEPDPKLRRNLWAAAGWLAGGAFACKYPALISAVIPLGLLALADSIRRRQPSSVLAFSLACALVIAPWLAKNVVDTGNPVYPLGYQVFGGRHWNPAMDARWSHAHGRKPIALDQLAGALVDVAGRSDWQSSLYLALAPLAFLRPGPRRPTQAIALYAAYLFATWWLLTHRLDRFWLPMLPPLAILAGLGADWARSRSWTVLLTILFGLAYLANLAYASTHHVALPEWTHDLSELRTSVPERLNPALAKVDADLPPDARLLLVGQAAVFHVRHPLAYNTVFDDETFETLAAGKTPAEVRDALRRLGITHVFVDWFEVERYRSPGNYGFTDFITPALFDGLVKARVLETPSHPGERQELYRVAPG